MGKDTYIQFNKCTFLGNINYIGTSSERCEFNDNISNNISYFNFTPELEYMKLNNNYEIGIYKLPFSASDKLTLNFDNTMNFDSDRRIMLDQNLYRISDHTSLVRLN